ncbi:hypothetical protein QQ73_09815, partial [Candidatus Endoriftia persephone str. Guaymas]|nr:hypothetical protein [Candidatus Endoriftia persephone str. Guaymas]
HAQLKNAELSATYHLQHVTKLRKAKIFTELPGAFEQWGTSLITLGKYDQAAEVFQVTSQTSNWYSFFDLS